MNFPAGQKWFSWKRLLGLGVTLALLLFVFSKIDRAAVFGALRQTRWSWLAAGFLAYALALFFAGLRSHIALRAIGCSVSTSASGRLFLIGHFFFVALFGAAGGDIAKSALYARWFRFGLPEVLAAAQLDRALGLGGSMLTFALVGALAFATGGFAVLAQDETPVAGRWTALLLGLALIAFLLLVLWKPRGDGPVARTLRALRFGAGRLASTPRLATPGLLFALLAQIALSAVFALCLAAVSSAPLPWARLAWTFPAITTMSCLPFTFAGAGAREAAALSLLGLFGVPAGECVAAALLTLVLKLTWGGLGAVKFWREEMLTAKNSQRPMPRTISVVIPAINESASLPATIRSLRAIPEIAEIILVDGGSKDATREVAAQLGCRVFTSAPGRGGQMRLGAAQAVGDVVLLLHADTTLPPEAGRAALNCLRDATVVAGGFWKVFREPTFLLLGSRWKCALRLMLGRRMAGDQSIFIRREILEQIGGVPDMPLMEEFELCRKLRQTGRLALADATIVTSARRFQKLGVLRTYLRMWWVTELYRLGKSPQELRKIYERE